MKKAISIILAIVFAVSMVACGGSADTDTQPGTQPDNTPAAKELIYPFGLVNRPIGMEGGYNYKTACYQDQTLETDGYVYIRDYTVTPVEGEEGMVDKSVTVGFVFNDYNAYSYGTMAYLLYSDIDGDGVLGGTDRWTVEHEGETYEVNVVRDEFLARQWLANNVYVSFYNLTLRMPEGYDDIALFFYNAKNQFGMTDDVGELPDGTNIAEVVDQDTQWFVLGGEDGTYYGQPIETQQPVADPAAIIYDRLYQMDAPPPMPGDPVYDYLPAEPGSDNTEKQPENNDSDTLPVAPDDYVKEPDNPPASDNYVDNTDSWIELTDWTVDEIDGNGDYQPLNFFLLTHGWNETLQTRYRSFSDADGTIQEFTLQAMRDGSVTMDIIGTEITGESVCFEFALLDEEGYELSVTKVDIPVKR